MISKEELIEYMNEKSYKPLTAQDLISALEVAEVEEFLMLLTRWRRLAKLS